MGEHPILANVREALCVLKANDDKFNTRTVIIEGGAVKGVEVATPSTSLVFFAFCGRLSHPPNVFPPFLLPLHLHLHLLISCLVLLRGVERRAIISTDKNDAEERPNGLYGNEFAKVFIISASFSFPFPFPSFIFPFVSPLFFRHLRRLSPRQ